MEIDFVTRLIALIEQGILRAVFSGGRKIVKKMVLRPIETKVGAQFQVENFIGQQVMHDNVACTAIGEYLKTKQIEEFKQIDLFYTDKTVTFLLSKSGKITERTTGATNIKHDTTHNRTKNYLLREGEDIPFLRELGVFGSENRLVKAMADKFKQINRFVELVHDELKSFDKTKITILDFGCGKSYLTFALHYYFTSIRQLQVNIIGYDLKEDVVNKCNALAKKYGYSNLQFIVGDVGKQELDFDVDMVVTLHACDTATDYALFKAINNKVQYVFSVPCCQHELNAQIKAAGEWAMLTKHGLIKERFSALLTDTIRAEVIEAYGYKVDALEFVDFEHSPKNLMLRCKLKSIKLQPDLTRAKKLLTQFNSKHTLIELIEDNKKSI